MEAEDELLSVLWEGWLKKKTPRGLVKVWQNRYFRLRGDVLEYYKSDQPGASLQGMIPLQIMSTIKLHPRSKKGGCRFDLMITGADGLPGRVFSLLAPSRDLTEKLVRSLSNMLQQPLDEHTQRIDLSTLDLTGSFWKRIGELERRRAGANAADMRRGGEGGTTTGIGAASPAGAAASATTSPAGVLGAAPKHRGVLPRSNFMTGMLGAGNSATAAAAAAAVEGTQEAVVPGANQPGEGAPNRPQRVEGEPPYRILQELHPSPPLGNLYLARDTESKLPFYMHVINRIADEDTTPPGGGAGGGGQGVDGNAGLPTVMTRSQLREMALLWSDTCKLLHPFLMRAVSRGETPDRCWLIYPYPHHAPLHAHLAAVLRSREEERGWEKGLHTDNEEDSSESEEESDWERDMEEEDEEDFEEEEDAEEEDDFDEEDEFAEEDEYLDEDEDEGAYIRRQLRRRRRRRRQRHRRRNRSIRLKPPPLVLDPLLLRHLASELLLLLEYLHARNLVATHLDLKHLFLTEQGHVQLVDFFIAEKKEGQIKRREYSEPEYISPEAHQGDQEDYRSDYWRLGVCLYQLLTGGLPPGFTRLQGAPSARSRANAYADTWGGDGSGGSRSMAPDPSVLQARQLAQGIITFDASDESMLPFPLEMAHHTPLKEFIKGLLHIDPNQRLGGDKSDTTNTVGVSLTEAQVKQRAMHTMITHQVFQGVDFNMLRQMVQEFQRPLDARGGGERGGAGGGRDSFITSPSPLLRSTPIRAPDYVFRSLLYASHRYPLHPSPAWQSVRTEHNLVVTVVSGRNLLGGAAAIHTLQQMGRLRGGGSGAGSLRGRTMSIGGASPSPSLSPMSSPASPTFFPSTPPSSTSFTPFPVPDASIGRCLYVKVIVAGKAFKTPITSQSPSPSRPLWMWAHRMVFGCMDTDTLETSEVVVRLLAKDEESFHDATVGSVTIPMKHIYHTWKQMQQAQAHEEALARQKEQSVGAVPLRPPPPPPSLLDGWYYVIGSDGFVVGELRLQFEMSPPQPRGLLGESEGLLGGGVGAGMAANKVLLSHAPSLLITPFHSARRFSAIFGSAYSSETLREHLASQPHPDTLREISRMQLVPRGEVEADQYMHLLMGMVPEEAGLDEMDAMDRARAAHLYAATMDPSRPMLIPRRILPRLLAHTAKMPGNNGSATAGGGPAKKSWSHPSVEPISRGVTTTVAEEEEEDEDEVEDKVDKVLNILTRPTRWTMSQGTGGSGVSSPRQVSPAREASGSVLTGTAPSSGRRNLPNGPTPSAAALMAGSAATGFLRGLVSKKKFRFQEKGFDLDLSYIGSRIIAMGFPSEGSEAAYRNPLGQVQLFFKTFHPGHFKIYNLCSERRYEHAKFESAECAGGQEGCVREVPFEDHNAPPFHHMIDLCVDAAAFLAADPDNVVAIHCKAGKGRTGVMVSALLLFCGACRHPDAALHYFARHRTSNAQGVTIPSQRRYVHYFHRYLTHYYDLNRPFAFEGIPLLLTHVRLTGIPNFDLVSGGCDPSFSLYQGGGAGGHERCVYDYMTHKSTLGGVGSRSGGSGQVSSTTTSDDTPTGDPVKEAKGHAVDHVDWKVGVWVRGDVKAVFYDRDRIGRQEKMCWSWFHTSMVAEGETGGSYLCIRKSKMDKAVKDKECKNFPPHFQVEFFFKSTPPYADPFEGEGEEEQEQQLAEEEFDSPAARRRANEPWRKAARAATGVCQQQSFDTYREWQAELDEQASTFQPEVA